MNIGIVYNLRPTGLSRTDPRFESAIEGDEQKTIDAIGHALKSLGHRVSYFPSHPKLYHDLEHAKSRVDLILNLAEGINPAGADREAQLPMLAEILGIPYTGPGPLSAALILNKVRAKEIWRSHGLQTANWQLVSAVSDLATLSLAYPLIVKPVSEGSGIGIKSGSIVNSKAELRRAVLPILTTFSNQALVEEFLPGREFTVALVGNGDSLTVLPIVEINFASFPQGAPPIDSFEAKFVYGATGQAVETEFCPAKISKVLARRISDLAVGCYRAVGCRDFGRLDIRLDSRGVPHVLEINSPPGLMSDPNESSFFTISARAHGWDLPAMLAHILAAATKRLKLQN